MMRDLQPFWFGTAAEDQYFTDRKDDTARLEANFTYGINSILISPRRWGKTSLVLKVSKLVEAKHSGIKIVMMDAFSARTPQEFCEILSASLIKQTSSKLEEWISYGRQLLGHLAPVFSFGADPFNDFSVKFDFTRQNQDIDYVLNLPEKIAKEKGVRMILCIDEFQQIGEFEDSHSFQARMRGVWQLQKNVNYCLYGSKRHMMINIFTSPSAPFYKFGDIIDLQRIPTEYWVEYICHRFADTGKNISAELAEKICSVVQNNSSYVQQFAWYVWHATPNDASEESLLKGFSVLMAQNVALFEKQTENLPSTQYNYLLAMADGVKTGFSTEENITKYDLKNSASVTSAQKALEKKELIFIRNKEAYFTDPLLPFWLKQRSHPSLNPFERTFL